MMLIKFPRFLFLILLVICNDNCQLNQGDEKYKEWKIAGGTNESIHYSSLNQIDTSNVNSLKVAWTYQSEKGDSTQFGPMECNPIIVDDVLYGVSPKLKLFAIDAATGVQKWQFDPADSLSNVSWHRKSVNMNRGVAYWQEGDDKRIIYTVGSVAYAVNATSGKLIPSFGVNGGINLNKGLDRDENSVFVAPTSPVTIFKSLFFLSGLVGDETPGHIRAFDVKTGQQKWIFHTIPYPDEPGFETWEDTTAYKYLGSANSWAGFSLDVKRGILFAPIGNPTDDFYGGRRLGKGLYGNSLVALDAITGKLIWHFQTVHHDVWDMDLPAPPALVTIWKNDKPIDAVAQTTKTGFVFIFERETGKPLYPIEEKPVDIGTLLVGEKLWPTQPMPLLPKPFVRQTFAENDLNKALGISTLNELKDRFKTYHAGKMFTPPSVEGTVILPGYDGGGEWGGPAVDPKSNILYVNANEMAWVLNMVKKKPQFKAPKTNLEAGKNLYTQYCMGCHGPDLKGSGDYPSIVTTEKKYSTSTLIELLKTGRRMMPGFNNLAHVDKNAIASYILHDKKEQEKKYAGNFKIKPENENTGYNFTGYNKFLTKEGYPAINPPWGTLNAINLNTGELVWKIPLGEFPELKAKGIPATGRENYGGPLVTAGGVLFIGASADGKFRAINKNTGKIIWETDLPAPGVATPAVYEVNGKQYVVIACGGSKWGGKSSDKYVAFALPTSLPPNKPS
jgi:quinoprotein glucose dehydrogenase